MNLVQLRYFQTVCRLQNMTHAAELLHVSQPSISAAIKELEAEFHVTLFHRRYRGMIMTPEGERFLDLANGLLSHADQVQQAMADIGQRRQLLRLGIPPVIGSLLLPQIIHGFLEKNPDFPLIIEEGGRQELEQELSVSQLDLAFLLHDRPFDDSWDTIPVLDLETLCCVSMLHPLANRRSVAIPDLAEEPLVLFKNSHFQTRNVLDRYAVAGITPRVLHYTDQVLTVQRMVSRNLAVGFLFNRLAEPLRDLVGIPLDPPMTLQLSLVWKRSGYRFPNMDQFIDSIRSFRLDASFF